MPQRSTSGARRDRFLAVLQNRPDHLTGRRPGVVPGRAVHAGARDQDVSRAEGVGPRGASGSQSRGGGADSGAAPGVRLARRPDHLRYRSPVVRAQDRHRAGRRLRPPAHPERTVRLSQSGRVRARLGGELACLHLPVLRRRARQGLRTARRAQPHGGGRHRRRCPHRRHGLGGTEQHRGRRGASGGGRPQRQRPLLRSDGRRDGAADGRAPAQARLRAFPQPGQAPVAAGARHRPSAVLGTACGEIRRQGLADPADDVPGPGAEVPRTGRRARHRGARRGAAEREGLSRPGPRALPDAEGPGLRAG